MKVLYYTWETRGMWIPILGLNFFDKSVLFLYTTLTLCSEFLCFLDYSTHMVILM